MKVSLSWLKELVPLPDDLDVDDLAARCQQLGLLVEAVQRPVRLDSVVVAEVKECRPIEGAKKVQLVVVDDGTVADREVMCGAFNFAPGDLVPLAQPGAVLPGGFEISVREVKSLGVTSHGMLCAADELGLGDDHSGIMVLDTTAPLGTPVAGVLGLDDVVVEFEITPNRPDCMSVAGIARELAAAYGLPLTLPDIGVETSGADAATLVAVRVEDAERCPRYAALVVEGTRPQPSPPWMAQRLVAAGVRPINSIVDVTNYVLLLWGQPLHAFDLDRLAGPEIVVRRACAGEQITTLDGAQRSLSETDLLICDAARPVAIAGVMGGEDTEVRDETTRVLVESAHFQPASVMQTSKRLGLRSESSARFERGTDPGGCVRAALHAAQLMVELGGGTVRPGVVDVDATAAPRTISLRPARVNSLLGTELPADEMLALLAGIGIEGVGGDSSTADLVVPSWRAYDLEREVDLVEEVARLHGYNNIRRTLPPGRDRVGGLTPGQAAERALRAALRAAGVNEAVTYTFVGQAPYEALGWGEPARVTVTNPLREEERYLRNSLVPTLLTAAAYNVARNAPGVRLGEVGTVFEPSGELLPLERRMLGLVLSGVDLDNRAWGQGRGRPYDVFDLLGVIESVGEDLGIEVRLDPDAKELPPGLHPARAAGIVVAGRPSGWLGQLHPRVADAFGLPPSTVVAEAAVAAFVEAATARVDRYEKVPQVPASFYDLAFVVDEHVRAGDLAEVLVEAGGTLCRRVSLFDVFRGGQLPAGKKSLAYEVTFQAPDRTLSDADVKPAVDAMVSAAGDRFGAALRS